MKCVTNMFDNITSIQVNLTSVYSPVFECILIGYFYNYSCETLYIAQTKWNQIALTTFVRWRYCIYSFLIDSWFHAGLLTSTGQAKDLAPEWVKKCLSRCSFRRKTFSHNRQVHPSSSAEWVLSCRLQISIGIRSFQNLTEETSTRFSP